MLALVIKVISSRIVDLKSGELLIRSKIKEYIVRGAVNPEVFLACGEKLVNNINLIRKDVV